MEMPLFEFMNIIDDTANKKQCRICKEWKDMSEFYNNNRKCKICFKERYKERNKEYYSRPEIKERQQEYFKKYYNRNRKHRIKYNIEYINKTRMNNTLYIFYETQIKKTKIGISNNYKQRYKTFVSHSGYENLKVLFVYQHDNNRDIEIFAHTMFYEYRIKGTEWFKISINKIKVIVDKILEAYPNGKIIEDNLGEGCGNNL